MSKSGDILARAPRASEADGARAEMEALRSRIDGLERALARIRDRAIGKLPELESPPDIRLLTIYVVAAVALEGAETR